MNWVQFSAILARRARAEAVSPDTILFGAGLNISSVAFLESIMEMEEDTGEEIDVDNLGLEIRTAGQLFVHLFPKGAMP
ncbi:MAG: phosphopantetheine-binding protein [bacterium]